MIDKALGDSQAAATQRYTHLWNNLVADLAEKGGAKKKGVKNAPDNVAVLPPRVENRACGDSLQGGGKLSGNLLPSLDALVSAPENLNGNILDLWDMLAAHSDMPDPASGGPVWQLTALACSRRSGAPVLFRQTQDSQIAFAVTQWLSKWRFGPLEAHWGFGSPLLGPHAVDLLQEAIEQLRRASKQASITLSIPGLTPRSPLMHQLLAAFPACQAQRQDSHAAASLEGGFEGWLTRRSRNFRQKLGRAQRKAKQRSVSLVRYAPKSEHDARALYLRMLDVERCSWKGPVREGLLALKSFYGELLCGYARRSAARVIIARCEGQDIGFCFGGLSHGVYRGQQTSYAEAWSDCSLGLLMHAETAMWLCDDGAHLQHFGPVQRSMSYKASFCELSWPSIELMLDR